jgi:adenylate kinase family enzyme
MAPFPYHRIVVVGVTGCGKSMLAEKLAQGLGLDFIDLDALYWKPDWVESSDEEFRAKVEAATRLPAWALAGNYSKLRDLIWPRAEAVVWLDYPFLLVFGRLCKRTWQRWRTQEPLWGSNYERFWPQLKIWSKKSLFYWQVHSYREHKRVYPQLFASPEYTHLKVFHFKQPGELEEWLGGIVTVRN